VLETLKTLTISSARVKEMVRTEGEEVLHKIRGAKAEHPAGDGPLGQLGVGRRAVQPDRPPPVVRDLPPFAETPTSID
jgi:hypothetical protein